MNPFRLASVVALAALLAPSAHAIQPATPAVRLVELTPYTGRATRAEPGRLPEGVEGRLPETDGQGFALSIPAGMYSGRDARSLSAALSELLPATGFTGSVDTLTRVAETTLPALDAEDVALERELDQRALEAELTERFGRLGEPTTLALDLQADAAEARLATSHRVVRYTQSVDGLAVEGLGVAVVIDDTDGSVVRISGALVNDARVERVAIEADRAAALAQAYLEAETRVSSLTTPVAGAVATDTGVRPAYTVDAQTRAGPFRVRVDGATGAILAVEALAKPYTSGEGRSFTPDPDGAAETTIFEVNDAVGGKFTLANADYLTVSTVGADGCGTTPLSVSGSSYANFNVAPYNSTLNVRDATAPDYNCRMQEVSVFAQVHDAVYAFEMNGSQPIPTLAVDVNDDDACGYGPDNACASGNYLSFGIGTGTRDGSTSADALLNTALDQTVVVHELGHVVNGAQYAVSGGTLHDSVNEGLADYWAGVLLDTEVAGAWAGKNRGFTVQNGMIPRVFDKADVFPHHIVIGGNEPHANGQVVGWGLANMRDGIVRRSPLGAKIADDILLDAMTTSGLGISNSDKTARIYFSFQDLFANLLVSAGNTMERVDVLQGFARAGVFATKREAVIDISDDFLAKSDAAPTFTVWGGEAFYVDGEDVIDIIPQFNPCFEVELANDEAFTQNHVVSAESCTIDWTNSNPRGTWTPTAAEWDKVNDGAVVYYRAWTRQKDGTSERRSDRTMAGFMQVPVARAIINDGNGSSCNSSGGTASGVGLLAGLALLLRRRR